MQLRMPDMKLVLKRGCLRGLKTAVREEGWGASIGSLFGVLVIAQVVVLLVVGVHAGLTQLREQTDIRLEILETAEDVQIQDLMQNIQSLSYVQDVVYVTREQALERQKLRDPQLIEFLTKFGIANPFPETMGVRLKTLNDYPKFLTFIQQAVFAKTVNPKFLSQTTDQETQVYRLLGVIDSARAVLLLFIGLLMVVLIFVVVELVRRRALLKQEELFVEQLVGAAPLAILVPFWTEILALLVVAYTLSLILITGCLFVLPTLVPALGPDGLFAAWGQTSKLTLMAWLPWLLPLEILMLPLIAAFGTFLALRPKLTMSTLPLAA
jgi:cell division transport system permease protein